LMACGTCLEFFKVRPVPEVEAATMKHLLALMRDDPAVVTV
jgi:hypothetical protein